MVALSARTSRADMKMLAKRIELSQADEIQMMQDWLKRAARRCRTPTRITRTAPR